MLSHAHAACITPPPPPPRRARYLLLGATRLVLFDDMDDPTHSTAAALHALASADGALPPALKGKIVVARGLCLEETMARASMHADCQVLANNLCRHWARADAAAHPERPAFVVSKQPPRSNPAPATQGARCTHTPAWHAKRDACMRLPPLLLRRSAGPRRVHGARHAGWRAVAARARRR